MLSQMSRDTSQWRDIFAALPSVSPKIYQFQSFINDIVALLRAPFNEKNRQLKVNALKDLQLHFEEWQDTYLLLQREINELSKQKASHDKKTLAFLKQQLFTLQPGIHFLSKLKNNWFCVKPNNMISIPLLPARAYEESIAITNPMTVRPKIELSTIHDWLNQISSSEKKAEINELLNHWRFYLQHLRTELLTEFFQISLSGKPELRHHRLQTINQTLHEISFDEHTINLLADKLIQITNQESVSSNITLPNLSEIGFHLNRLVNLAEQNHQQIFNQVRQLSFAFQTIRNNENRLDYFQSLEQRLNQYQTDLNQRLTMIAYCLTQLNQYQLHLLCGVCKNIIAECEGCDKLFLYQLDEQNKIAHQLKLQFLLHQQTLLATLAELNALKNWWHQHKQNLFSHEQYAAFQTWIKNTLADFSQIEQALQNQETLTDDFFNESRQYCLNRQQQMIEFLQSVNQFKLAEMNYFHQHYPNVISAKQYLIIQTACQQLRAKSNDLLYQLNMAEQTQQEKNVFQAVEKLATPEELIFITKKIDTITAQYKKLNSSQYGNDVNRLLNNFMTSKTKDFTSQQQNQDQLRLLLEKHHVIQGDLVKLLSLKDKLDIYLIQLGSNLSEKHLSTPPLNLPKEFIVKLLALRNRSQSLQQSITQLINQLNQLLELIQDKINQLKSQNKSPITKFFKPLPRGLKYRPLIDPKLLNNNWQVVMSEKQLPILMSNKGLRFYSQCDTWSWLRKRRGEEKLSSYTKENEEDTVRQMIDQAKANGWKLIQITGEKKNLIMLATAHAEALGLDIDWSVLDKFCFKESQTYLKLVENEKTKFDRSQNPHTQPETINITCDFTSLHS